MIELAGDHAAQSEVRPLARQVQHQEPRRRQDQGEAQEPPGRRSASARGREAGAGTRPTELNCSDSRNKTSSRWNWSTAQRSATAA